MRTLFIAGPGPNQRALANRLHARAPLDAIARVGMRPAARRRPLLPRIISATLARSLRHAWRATLSKLDGAYPAWPTVELSSHAHVNDTTMLALADQGRFDVVLVSGTDLIREPLIAALSRHGRIMNLHTGLSPYLRGGPNCTNWAIALGEFDLIGNTVMWLDRGIDSGAIVASERTHLTGRENLPELHLKVMDHAHDLYCRCYARFAAGAPVPAVPQALLGEGRMFLTRDWTARRMLDAVRNFHFNYGPGALVTDRSLRLISLENGDAIDGAGDGTGEFTTTTVAPLGPSV